MDPVLLLRDTSLFLNTGVTLPCLHDPQRFLLVFVVIAEEDVLLTLCRDLVEVRHLHHFLMLDEPCGRGGGRQLSCLLLQVLEGLDYLDVELSLVRRV